MKKQFNIIEKYDQEIRSLFFGRGFDHEELRRILTRFHLETIKEKTQIDMSTPKSKFMEEWEKLRKESDLNVIRFQDVMMELIDKYKEDKDVSSSGGLVAGSGVKQSPGKVHVG